jgi:hypothetical protein
VVFALCEHEACKSSRPQCRRCCPDTVSKAKDIREAIDKVAADPTVPNNLRRSKALDGFPHSGRDWRVSFTLDRQAGVMSVFEIAPRGGAYR